MRVFCFHGLDVHMNPFFVLFLLMYASAGLLRETLLAFWVVVLHELAHIVAAGCFGFRAYRIELLPFGGVASFSESLAGHPGAEAIIALAGPLHNFTFAAIIAALSRGHGIPPSLARFLVETNLAIGVFNLIPAIPLDGGRVLRAALVPRIGMIRATAAAVCMGRLVGVGVLVLGSYLVFLGRCNVLIPSLGGFLVFAASREVSAASYVKVRDGLRKRGRLLRDGSIRAEVLASHEATSCRETARRFIPGKLNIVVVFNDRLDIIGIVTEIDVLEAMVRHGADEPIGSLVA